MMNRYYIIQEIMTDADGLVSVKVIKTTEIMPVVPDDEDNDNE